MKNKLRPVFPVLALGFSVILSSVSAVAAEPSSKPAKESQGKGSARPYPLDVCIVTDNDLGSMGDEQVMVYEGQTIKFCCKPCERKFLKAPEKYLAKLAPKKEP